MLQIYNSKSQQKEIFKPIVPGQVGLYVCGVTVYDYSHIGHARAYISFDVIKRYLQWSGFKVRHVQNITDIDDKIIKRAREQNEPYDVITKRFIDAWHEDIQALNVLLPDIEPKATEFISEMIALILQLLDKGYAYTGKDGDIFFNVQKFKDYGSLSHRNLDDLLAGARIDVNDAKQHPLDFVLWKMAKPNEPAWDSPFGLGRPGWHTECVVMSTKELGETFDIHGGGHDLKFPHHENELAQCESLTKKPFVHYWMHVGFLQIHQEKMAKSLGNFITIRDFLKNNDAEVLRLFSLSSHYRSPVDFTEDNINTAKVNLEKLYTALHRFNEAEEAAGLARPVPGGSSDDALSKFTDDAVSKFKKAMDDDFNTPVAMGVLFDRARAINIALDDNKIEEARSAYLVLKQLGAVLGILYQNPERFLKGDGAEGAEAKEIEALIKERNEARAEKNWAKSDAIRAELLARGIVLEDKAGATGWRRV